MVGTKERETATPPTDLGGNGNRNYTGPGRETFEGGDDWFSGEFYTIIVQEFPGQRVRVNLGHEAIIGMTIEPEIIDRNRLQGMPSSIITDSFKASPKYSNYPIN